MSGDSLAQESGFREPCYVEFAYGTWLNESISEDTQERKETVTEEQSCAYPTVRATTGPGADYPRTEVPPVSGGDTFLDYPETEIVPIPGAGDALAQGDSFVEPCGADFAFRTWANEPTSRPTQIIKTSRAHLECVEVPGPEVGGWVRFTTPQIVAETACIYNAGDDAYHSTGPAAPLPGMRVRASFPFHRSFRPTKFKVQSQDNSFDYWDWKLLDTVENEIAVVRVQFPNNPQAFPGDEAESNEAEIDFDTYGNDLYYIEAQRDSSGSLNDIWFWVPVDVNWSYMVPNADDFWGGAGTAWNLVNNGIIGGTPNDSSFITLTPSIPTYRARMSELSYGGGLINSSELRVSVRARNNGGSDNIRIMTFWEGTTPNDVYDFPATTDWKTYSFSTAIPSKNVSETAGAVIHVQNLSGTFDVDVSEIEAEFVISNSWSEHIGTGIGPTAHTNSDWTGALDLYWDGAAWNSYAGGNSLQEVGSWVNGYRPSKIRIDYTDVGTFNLQLFDTAFNVIASDAAYVSGTELDITFVGNDIRNIGLAGSTASLVITSIEFLG